MTKHFIEIFILTFTLSTGCASKPDTSRWPFPDANKCADYYEDLSKLSFQLADIAKMQLAVEQDPVKQDSLKTIMNDMIIEGRKQLDSSYYFKSLKQ